MVVPGLDEIGCLGKEEEVDLGPFGIGPVSSDDEGENGVTVRVDGLDGEEEVLRWGALEMVDT